MANVSAFLKPTKKQPTTKVRFYVSRGRTEKRLFYTSDIEVNADFFDTKKQIIKERIVYDNNAREIFNTKVSNLKTNILKAYNNAENKELLTSQLFEVEIDKVLHPENFVVIEEVIAPTTLLVHVSEFIQNAAKRKNKKTNTYISNGTIKSYNTNYQRLVDFAAYKGKTDFSFSEIDINFYNDYVDFLTNRKVTIKMVRGVELNIEKQYTLGTIGDAVKALKTFIAGVKDIPIERKELYVFTEEVDNVYLNETELQILRDYDFSAIPHLDRVVDWFLLLAWTASRISDKNQLGNIKNGFIKYEQQKTGASVSIPVHPVVKEIIAKYNGQLPNQISDQKINDYIKDACKLAGLNEMESTTRIRGGKRVTVNLPKYDLISSHACRRSFCTNMFLRGMDTLMIRSISGHKTEKSFLKYIKVSQQQHSELMAKKWSEIYK